MAARTIALRRVRLPRFELPAEQPEISATEYAARLEEARRHAASSKLDFLLIYGDREHFANLAFLTGYDPRFEEALLVLPAETGAPATLIVGNEGLGYAQVITLPAGVLEVRLFQGFSLLGQPRDAAVRIEPILRGCGIGRGRRVGAAGWKYAGPSESDDPTTWLETPSYLVDALRQLTGKASLVTNATAMFMDPADGLRSVNSADQLAAFEFASCYSSQAVRNAIEELRPGQSEFEAVANMGLNGLPHACHLMLSAGPRARIGLPSPSSRKIGRGEPFTTAVGLWGSLTCRAGFVAEGPRELGELGERYLERMVKPYFATVAAWYRTLGLGVTGGELRAAVDEALVRGGITLTLNPGHLIHLDEWVHSHVAPGNKTRFRSGMLVQADLIPVVPAGLFGTNIEDTIALADAKLRRELAGRYPGLWQRVQARRAFMQETLGLKLKPEVLPFSNLAGALSPFVLKPEMAMVFES